MQQAVMYSVAAARCKRCVRDERRPISRSCATRAAHAMVRKECVIKRLCAVSAAAVPSPSPLSPTTCPAREDIPECDCFSAPRKTRTIYVIARAKHAFIRDTDKRRY